MSTDRESGAVLLIVLVALALLAALAGVVARISQSEVAGLAADQAAFGRDNMMQSALAELGARLGAGADIAEDGETTVLSVPGGKVAVKVQAASGLVNPDYAGHQVLINALKAVGASDVQALHLADAIETGRGEGAIPAFHSLADVGRLFADEPLLWQKLRPYLTLLGKRRTLDPTTTPAILYPAAVALSAEAVDFNGLSTQSAKGLYELRLHVVGPGDDKDPDGALWTHLSVLLGRSGRLHVFITDWPEQGATR